MFELVVVGSALLLMSSIIRIGAFYGGRFIDSQLQYHAIIDLVQSRRRAVAVPEILNVQVDSSQSH